MPAIAETKTGYLALSRRVGETIFLTVPPSDAETVIEVTVFASERGKVRIGTLAPKFTIIERAELRPDYAPATPKRKPR